MTCPLCGRDALKVIYFGLPMRLCADESCSCLFGFWSWVAELLPIPTDEDEFKFLAYTGWYLPAVWKWLAGSSE